MGPLVVRPLSGVVLRHLTTWDVVFRWDVLEVRTRASTSLTTHFLHAMGRWFPFPIKAVLMDGGSEFQPGFESACQDQGIRLLVLPLKSPKLHGHVERAQRTHTEESYELYDGDFEIGPLNRVLLDWERGSTTPSTPTTP